MTIASWATVEGKFEDGAAYALRQPVYKFSGPNIPAFFSVRLAPPLVVTPDDIDQALEILTEVLNG